MSNLQEDRLLGERDTINELIQNVCEERDAIAQAFAADTNRLNGYLQWLQQQRNNVNYQLELLNEEETS